MNLILVVIALMMYTIFTTLSSSTNASTAEYSNTGGTDSSSVRSNNPSECMTFNFEERIIKVTCTITNLSQIADHLKEQDVIQKVLGEEKNWILNAGIKVDENAILYINSTGTSWLKIIADGEIAYPIEVLGRLKIDSVNISSWDPNINNYTR
jgi:hypothetical protein